MNESIDLNADLGEDESETGITRDLLMMKIISSCNIACGGHAGSTENIQRMLIAARENGVAAGAHPSYPDRQNFGRVSLSLSPLELSNSLKLQMGLIKKSSSQTGTTLHHIKPHGALYNDAQDDENLADILIELARSEGLPLVGMASTTLAKRALGSGISFIAEGFIDRRYTDSYRLVPRVEEGAIIPTKEARLKQAIALATGQSITSHSGSKIEIAAQTLCLHSDSEGALETARIVRQELEQINLTIEPVSFG